MGRHVEVSRVPKAKPFQVYLVADTVNNTWYCKKNKYAAYQKSWWTDSIAKARRFNRKSDAISSLKSVGTLRDTSFRYAIVPFDLHENPNYDYLKVDIVEY